MVTLFLTNSVMLFQPGGLSNKPGVSAMNLNLRLNMCTVMHKNLHLSLTVVTPFFPRDQLREATISYGPISL